MAVLHNLPPVLSLYNNIVEMKYPIDYSNSIMQELTEKRALEIMGRYGNDPQQLIAILLDIQTASNKNYVEQRWAELASSV
jgi:hypothetical protein